MDQREQFIDDVQRGRMSVLQLCAHYGVSRKMGDKWIARAREEGRQGLRDRSRAPLHWSRKLSEELADLLCALRLQHDDWGARKLLRVLRRRHPRRTDGPAPSTVSALFAREGLVTRRRRRRARPEHPGGGRIHTAAPNEEWTTDFTSEFRTGDGAWCYPLTLADQHTRFLFACQARPSTQTVTAWPVFERAFREYGLPRAIRSENGTPFATVGLHGLSRLSVWWLKLGIAHQRIRPGTPSEHGAQERMDRSLKRRAIRPAQATMRAQQRGITAFRHEYNEERPHEALGLETPVSCYAPSPRAYPARILAQDYPGHFTVKGVTTGGTFRFHNRLLYLANALSGERVGMEELDDGVWQIDFGAVLIATLDERDYIIRE